MQSLGGTQLRADLRGVAEEAYLQSELYIGPKVLPPLPVTAKSGQYPYISVTSGSLLRNEVKRRGPGANYARIARSFFNSNYTCQEYGIETPVDDSNAADVARFFPLESTETRMALRQVQLAHEIRAASKVFDPSVFSLTTSATAYTAANLATFDLGLDVDTAKQAIAARGESTEGLTAVMSQSMFNRVRASTRIQNRIRGTISTDSQLVLTREALAQCLDLKEVLVGAAAYDTSKQGAASPVMSNIWGDAYVWIGRCVPGGTQEQYFNGSTGFTLYWNDDAAIFQVESYREEAIRSVIIRARHNTDEKIVMASGAQLLVTQYS
jgi:hypothetical protein